MTELDEAVAVIKMQVRGHEGRIATMESDMSAVKINIALTMQIVKDRLPKRDNDEADKKAQNGGISPAAVKFIGILGGIITLLLGYILGNGGLP